MTVLLYACGLIGIALVIIGARCIYNAIELRRLKRSGYHKIAAKRYTRGSAHPEFMRGLAEILLLILLLVALLGWMGAGR